MELVALVAFYWLPKRADRPVVNKKSGASLLEEWEKLLFFFFSMVEGDKELDSSAPFIDKIAGKEWRFIKKLCRPGKCLIKSYGTEVV